MTLPDPLAEIGWLKEAPADFRQALLGAASTRLFEANATIWQAGDTDFGLLGIRSGDAGVLHAMSTPGSPFGHIVGPGYWTGEGPLLSGKPKTVTLVARTRVEVAMVSHRHVRSLLTSHPEYWQQIGRLALSTGQLASTIAADLLIPKSRRRCAATLLRLAGCRFESRHAAPTRVISIAQEELAAMANLTRHTTGPILHGFVETGLISLGYRTITINNPDVLRAIADGD